MKKLGSLLGDSEDIAHRKQLAIGGMNQLAEVWIRKDHIRKLLRLDLFYILVKPILTYNCGTWAMTKSKEDSIDAFHRPRAL